MSFNINDQSDLDNISNYEDFQIFYLTRKIQDQAKIRLVTVK